MNRSEHIAGVFSALAHPSRVDVLLALLPLATQGMTAGELAEKTGVPPSTLAHHLREMEAAQVIARTQEGRKTIVTPSLATLTQIAHLLTRLCCADQSPERPTL